MKKIVIIIFAGALAVGIGALFRESSSGGKRSVPASSVARTSKPAGAAIPRHPLPLLGKPLRVADDRRASLPPPAVRANSGPRKVTLSPSMLVELNAAMQTRVLQAPIADMGLAAKTAARLRESAVAFEKETEALKQGVLDGTLALTDFDTKLKISMAKHLAENKKILGAERSADLEQLRMQRGLKHLRESKDWYVGKGPRR